ncbi:MAG: hypothetical protein P1P88_21515 [Bacteroidales bacterium]|nr:hypothetical protein [Bacteroidales bacterium]
MTKFQLFSLLFLLPLFAAGQDIKTEVVYRRSSLFTMMITEPSRKYADTIQTTFINSPIPDKFNDHILDCRIIENGISESIKKRPEKIAAQELNITNFLNSNDIAKKMVAKWFNRQPDGSFNMGLVAERGSYDASEMDVNLARSSKRGEALLADAGEELINNTFLIVNDFDYVSKEEVAKKVKVGLAILKEVALAVDEANKDENQKDEDNQSALVDAIDVADIGLTVVGKGYVVRTTSYLYQLDWNDSVAAVLYNEYWLDENSDDIARKEAFENSDIFKLKLIGHEVAWADLQSTIFTQKSEEDLVRIATVRAIDAVIAKLQKKYEVFRTKTPLYSIDPLSAKIGLKESLEKGDKFEVLEQIQDKNGRTKYKRKGIIRVDKDQIWDNRYMAGEEPDEAKNPNAGLGYTIFNGTGKFYPGMLIRQIN